MDEDAFKRAIGENFEEKRKAVLDRLAYERNMKQELNKIYSGQVKVGRNDPCPCGSGKKYKKCCGKNIDILR